MTPDSVRNEIDRLLSESLKAELVIDSATPVVNFSSNNIRTITWAGFSPSTDILFATIDEYKWLVQNRQFSFILFDGSLMQISYTFQRNDLIGHRLYFYPFPFLLEPEEWEIYREMGFGLLDILEDFSFEEFQRYLRLRSPTRFDFDQEQAGENHPTSHLHILRNDCRIPVFAPLSIGHFIQFVFKNFYPEQWETYEFLRNWPYEWFKRAITNNEISQIHLNCVQP